MKQMIRKIGMFMLTAVLVCTLVSCNKKDETVKVLDETDGKSEYLSFFSSNSFSESDIGKYWSERFSENYNKKIYINYDGASYYADKGLSYRELLEKRMNSSMPDDLYIINAEDVLEFEKKGYWKDLSGMDFVDNLTDAARYQSTYNGKVFSVPLTFTGFGFYWNADMLKKYGLSIPENEEEFMKVCEKLKKHGILPYGANKGYALTVPAMCKGMSQIYGSADRKEKIHDLNSGKVPVSRYMQEGFQLLSKLIDKGYLDPKQAMSTTPRDELDLFLKEKCAFICADLNVADYIEVKKCNFQYKLTGLPVLENGSVAVYGTSTRLCINPNSKHLNEARKFVEMVGTKEALDKSAALKKTMSSAKNSKLKILPVQKEMCRLLKSPGQIPNQDFALRFNTWENIRDIGREICGGISVKKACEKFDALQVKEIKEYSED